MMKFLFLLLISVSAFASPREEAKAILSKFQNETDLVTRLDLFSKNFIGLPYGEGGPLGEGENGRYDQDPLYRFDTFDCTTYVETIVSLAQTTDVDSFERRMDEIRYENAEVDYLKRNHFTDLQWIPYNITNGLLKEINHLVLPKKERKVAEALINLPGWLNKIKIEEIRVPMASTSDRQNLLEELHAMSAQYSPIVAKVDYLPIDTLVARPKLLKLIPNGSIVNFVRPNWDLRDLIGTHQNISHQGFVFQTKDGTFLRHASTAGSVVNVLFLDYLKKYVGHATMKGIHLMKVNP